MTELLPSPLHLLWLANQQAVKPAYVKEQLLPCIERVNILDTEYMEDIVAVYAGSKETDGRTNHDIITQIRSNY